MSEQIIKGDAKMNVFDACKEKGIRVIELEEFDKPSLHIHNLADFLSIQSDYIFCYEDFADEFSFIEYLVGEVAKETVSDYRQQSKIKESAVNVLSTDSGFVSKYCRETKNFYFISKDNISYFIENDFSYTDDEIEKIRKKIQGIIKKILSEIEEEKKQENESIMNIILERKKEYSEQTTEKRREQIVNEIRFSLNQKLGITGYSDTRASKDYVRWVLEDCKKKA